MGTSKIDWKSASAVATLKTLWFGEGLKDAAIAERMGCTANAIRSVRGRLAEAHPGRGWTDATRVKQGTLRAARIASRQTNPEMRSTARWLAGNALARLACNRDASIHLTPDDPEQSGICRPVGYLPDDECIFVHLSALVASEGISQARKELERAICGEDDLNADADRALEIADTFVACVVRRSAALGIPVPDYTSTQLVRTVLEAVELWLRRASTMNVLERVAGDLLTSPNGMLEATEIHRDDTWDLLCSEAVGGDPRAHYWRLFGIDNRDASAASEAAE